MKDLVTIGEILIDLTYSGRDKGVPVYTANPGGAPANVAVAAARLGADAAFIGKVGSDSFGSVRASFSPFNPADDVYALADAVRAIARDKYRI